MSSPPPPPRRPQRGFDPDLDKYAPKPSALPPPALFQVLYFGACISLLVYLLTPAPISVKSAGEIELMRETCGDASSLLRRLSPHVLPGATTLSLDGAASAIMSGMSVRAAPLNYGGVLGGLISASEPGKSACKLAASLSHYLLTAAASLVALRPKFSPVGLPLCGFPSSVCVSVNDVVCHGIPAEREVLRRGDAVNVDVTTISPEGWFGDTSKMWLVGFPPLHLEGYDIHDERNREGDEFYERARLAAVTRDCLFLGISAVKAGASLGDIGAAIHGYAEEHGYSVVREYSGHGIGTAFHEGPRVLHYGDAGGGDVLEAGMTLTIEPMVNAGGAGIRAERDQWTVRTEDGSDSAQWEHTVLVTEDGFEILTMREGEEWPERVLKRLAEQKEREDR
ncbi:hypothetical protein TeGR_g11951, partial [Tetraparma gracilis]